MQEERFAQRSAGQNTPQRGGGQQQGFRALPQDIEAEQGVLGSMLLSPGVIPDTAEKLRAEDFYQPGHQLIFQAIIDLYSEDLAVDTLLVSNRLSNAGNLERVGGDPYLHKLLNLVPTAANAGYYADIVAEKALLRDLVRAGTKVVALGYEGVDGGDVESVLDQAQQEVCAIGEHRMSEDYQRINELISDTIDEMDYLSEHGALAEGTPTGFKDLDELTCGLHGGQMIIVAARPGVGKSTLAMDFMRSCTVKHGQPGIIFSLEMSKNEIVQRILSAEASVKLSDMRSGKMDEVQWSKIVNSIGTLENVPLYIDDSPTLTMMEIRSKARKLNQQHKLSLIVVDYLQLMSSGKKVESRQQEVSEFSRQLKLLAKELDVPVVAISQLNRGPESRTDKRPQLADLRESGSLEQDADMVMLLYRPDSQDPNSERAGEADIILAKHRGGPIDTVHVAHQLHYCKFVDLAQTPVGGALPAPSAPPPPIAPPPEG